MSNKVILADNGNVRMEADTISKNGHSSKSQKSRGNMFLTKTFGIIIIVGIFVSMVACSSPESDGIKAAKELCKCFQMVKTHGNIDRYSECAKKANELFNKLGDKYSTKKDKYEKFYNAYEDYKCH